MTITEFFDFLLKDTGFPMSEALKKLGQPQIVVFQHGAHRICQKFVTIYSDILFISLENLIKIGQCTLEI